MEKTVTISRISSFSSSRQPYYENSGGNISRISSFSISNPPELKIAQPAQAEQLVASSFDSNHWRQQIETATNNAINLDQGALEHCSHYKPDLQRDCIAASRALDDAYSTRSAKEIRQAIRKHDKACSATREAAHYPL